MVLASCSVLRQKSPSQAWLDSQQGKKAGSRACDIQACGIAKRQRAKQDPIDDGKNRGIRSNAQAENQHHDQGKYGLTRKRAHGMKKRTQKFQHISLKTSI